MKRIFLYLVLWVNISLAGSLSFNFENDVFFDNDLGYTNGAKIAIETVPENTNIISEYLLPYSPKENSHAVYQFMYTPDDISISENQPNDRQWAGVLGYEFITSTTNPSKRKYYATGFQLGVTGKYSYAEETQTYVHKITESQTSMGWNNQLPTIPAINVFYIFKYKHLDNNYNDLVWSSATSIGVNTRTTIGGSYRFGYNVPNDFILISEPVPHSIENNFRLYSFIGADASMVIYNYFLDAKESSVDKEYFIAEAYLGLALELKYIELKFKAISKTKEYQQEDATRPYGVITLTINF
jgi:lipid A 3-O-deacylase